MRRMRGITALLLSVLMILSTQGMAALAESRTAQAEHISETVSLNPMEEAAKKPERISGTMMLEEGEPGRLGELVPLERIEPEIYWNPGGILPGKITASASNAEEHHSVYESTATFSNAVKESDTYLFDRLIRATSSNAAKGDDRADGLSPERPVKSLETALVRADELAEEYGIDKSEVTIYAMSPMEVEDGHMYVLNGGGIRIASWDGRTYRNDTIFYLNGGQLTLMNTSLESGRAQADMEETELIRVDGGALQLGSGVQLNGRIVMEYRQTKGQAVWKTATGSEAGRKATASSWTEAGESGAGFSINDYIFSDQEGEWELLEDTSGESTWREPVIELVKGFDGTDGGFLLEIRGDEDLNTVTLAHTLYADQVSNEEFESFFQIRDFSGGQWSLSSTSEEAGMVHDTGAADLERFYADTGRVKKSRSISRLSPDSRNEDENDSVSKASSSPVTVKRLTATRAAAVQAGGAVYWDPVNGNDNNSGLTSALPVKGFIRARTVLNSSSNLKTLYIKNTATVSTGQTWDLPAGKELVADPSVWTGTGDPVLVRVVNGGNLFLSNMTIRNNLDRQNNVSVVVTGTGKLTLTGSTILTGQSDTKEITRVTQVKAFSGATVLLDSSWTGSIENSQKGIAANGSGATVTMNSGSIRRNDSYDPEVGLDTQEWGGGVSVESGAIFTMNGGTISENKAWAVGSGVFVSGANATFIMNGGSVSNNTVSGGNTQDTTVAMFQGVGICGFKDTTIIIDGRSSAVPPTVSDNKGYNTYGAGIFTHGILKIYNAHIRDNRILGTGAGAGITVSEWGILDMDNSKVTGNWLEGSSGNGGGIWISCQFEGNHTIANSEISDNRAAAGGGGISQTGPLKLTITDSKILRNRAVYGAGIFATVGSDNTNSQLRIERCQIENNMATSSPASAVNPQPLYSNGAGVQAHRLKVMIIDSSIVGNHGRGVAFYTSEQLFVVRGTQNGLMKISENGGSGLYTQDGIVSVFNAEISQNQRGGFFAATGGSGYFRDVEIMNNQNQSSGGGVHINSASPSYFTNVKVEGNTAPGIGGGIYLNGSLYWTETGDGLSSLKGNSSGTQGGGIYKNGSGAAVLDFSSEIQNSAGQQGSNLYLKGGNLYLTKGRLLQPTAQTDGIYNVYVDVAANSGSTYIDPSAGKVTIEKKNGASPDAIFLNTAASALTYLQAPPNNTAVLPIDLNPAGFSPGNTVIKPANLTQVSSWRVNTNGTNGELSAVEYQIPYTALKNAGINQGYSSGGNLPAATRLITQTSGELTDVVLDYVERRAVYIDGVNGNDTNTGIIPSEPLKTLKRAYECLNNYAKKYQEKYIVVVNTVMVNGTVNLSRTEYTGDGGTVSLSSAASVAPSAVTVQLLRYVKPYFAVNNQTVAQARGFDVEDFKGTLLEVASGGSLIVGAGVIFDGHSNAKTGTYLGEELQAGNGTAEAPMIYVNVNGSMTLQADGRLRENRNTFDSTTSSAGMEGGAVHNCGTVTISGGELTYSSAKKGGGIYNTGTVTVSGGQFRGNTAEKGPVAYQGGTFTIESGVSTLGDYRFYLASTENGSGWTDSVLQIGERIPADMTQRFTIDMAHAIVGRDVIRFTDTSAYPNGADAEHGHFVLGNTVPNSMFLVESTEDGAVLELQDWKLMKVEVPKDIYLVVNRDNRDDSTTVLSGIVTNQTELLGSPEYQIRNTGVYNVKVSITGMENVSASAGITAYGDIVLKDSAASAVGENDLYLGIMGMDTDAGNGLTFGEHALLTQGMNAFELGRLTAGSAGTFLFTGKVGTGFMDKYRDMNFPITETETGAKKYMDGTGEHGMVNARAKYLLKYKVELDR